jgi:pantetheine-phosphate adenylyltransferase
LVEYAEAQNARAIVRGLRMVSDFDFEFQMAIANRRMDPQIETILMMTKWEYSYISSTVVREIAILGGPFDQFVPESVVPVIQKSLNRRKS